jgi:hypothetical protein
MVMEVLAARWRLGEQWWPFPQNCRRPVDKLVDIGLVEVLKDRDPADSILVALTGPGRALWGLDQPAAPGLPTPTVTPTEYLVTVLPLDREETLIWSVQIQRRGRDQWAITSHGRCLSRTGDWDLEPSPSERTAEWRQAHRFSFSDAVHRAGDLAARLTINGVTATEAAERLRERSDP